MANPLQVLAGIAGIGAQGGRGALEGDVEGTVLKSKLDAQNEETKLRALHGLLAQQQLIKARLPWDEFHAGSVYGRDPLTGSLTFKSTLPLDPLKEAQRLKAEADARLAGSRADQAQTGVAPMPADIWNAWQDYQRQNPEKGYGNFWQWRKAQEHPAATRPVVGGPGSTFFDPVTQQPLYTAPNRPHYEAPHYTTDAAGNTTAVVPQRGPNGEITGYTQAPQGAIGKPQAPPGYPTNRLQLIAQGAVVDPNLSQEDARKTLAAMEQSAIRVATGKYEAADQIRNKQLTPEALEMEATRYLQTGKLPGMGTGGYAGRVAIINKATELAQAQGIPFDELTARQGAMTASQVELSNLQKQRGPIMAFAKTADKNLDIALEMSDRMSRGDIQTVNDFLQSGRRNFGSVEASNFATAVQVGVNETARVLSGSQSGPVTDKARQDIADMLNTKQSPAQFKGALAILKRDMNNRNAGFDERIREIQEGMRTNPLVRSGGGAGAGMRDVIGPDGVPGKVPAGTDLSKYPGYQWKGAAPLSAPGGAPALPAPSAPPPTPGTAPRMPGAPGARNLTPTVPRDRTDMPEIPVSSANRAYLKSLVAEIMAQHYPGKQPRDIASNPALAAEFDEMLKMRYWSANPQKAR